MFKTSCKTNMNIAQFGVGSIIEADGGGDYYLVIGLKDSDSVGLVSFKTWRRVGEMLLVSDPNYLTRHEAELLCEQTGYQHTFSDFSLHARGLKYIHEYLNFKDFALK